MRRLFYKSVPLTIFFIAMSFLVTIVSLLIFQVNNTEKKTEALSENAVEILVRQDVTDGTYQKDDLINFLKECPVPLTILQENVVANGAYIYSSSKDFLNHFQKSSVFSQLDRPTAQIIIADPLLKECFTQEDKYFYFFNNTNFEVTDTFPKGAMPLDSYAPFCYILEQNPNEVLNINFYLDAGENTQEVFTALKDEITKKSSISTVASRELRPQNGMTDSFQGDRRIFSLILALVVCLVLLNLYRIVYFWLQSRKKELYIRMLTGSPKKGMSRGVFYQFTAVVTAACLIGTAAAWTFVLSGLISVPLTAASVLWSTSFLLIFLTASLALSISLLAAFLKKHLYQTWGE